MSDFPKEVKIFLHGSKEANYDKGVKLGLAGEALNYFMYTLYEVEVVLQVNEDGSSNIVEFNNSAISYRSE